MPRTRKAEFISHGTEYLPPVQQKKREVPRRKEKLTVIDVDDAPQSSRQSSLGFTSTARSVQSAPVIPLTQAQNTFNFNEIDDDDDDDLLMTSSKEVTNQQSRPKTAEVKCEEIYKKLCRRMKTEPLARFIKQIGNPIITLKAQGADLRALMSVCTSLLYLPSVTRLDLTGNDLHSKVIHIIGELLRENPNLDELVLCNCGLHGKMQELVSTLGICKTLRKINVSNNRLNDDDAEHIGELMKTAKDMSDLVMSHNEVSERGGKHIGEALAVNQTLEHLDVAWNHLRGRGAESISLALIKNSTLLRLDLSWNGFAFQGTSALSEALKRNTTLAFLDISNNRIHPPALMELLKGLLVNTTLQRLRLGPNPITAISTTAIIATIQRNTASQLEFLDLSGVVVDDAFEKILEKIHEERPNFLAVFDRSLPIHKLRYDERHRKYEELRRTVLNIDPLRMLWLTKKNLRVIDLFNRIDRDSNARLSRFEIKALLERNSDFQGEKFHLSSKALDDIMKYLDTNNDGEVDLREFADGERRFKRQAIAAAKQDQIEAEQEGLPLSSAELSGKFSQTYRPDIANADLNRRFSQIALEGLEADSGSKSAKQKASKVPELPNIT